MKKAPIVVNPTSSFNTPPKETKLDYHNNNLVSDLDHLLKDPISLLYTDWELLCEVAKIVAKRKPPASDMTDCATGLCYGQRSESIYKKAMDIAQRNAGK